MLGFFHAAASVIQSALDIVVPRKERIVRIEQYSLEDIPLNPREHEACGVRITTLLSYADPAVNDLIRALKYDQSDAAAQLLAAILGEYLLDEIANLRSFSARSIVLIPVPLHFSRARERGFNQVEKVLRALPAEFQNGTLSRVASGALERTRATAPQTRLSRAERLKNVTDAFSLSGPSAIDNAYVILIDDVTTTGATLSEAARSLGKTPRTLLALAHA
jgi:ComF family protein